jgi:hypothetical protein
MTSFDGSLPISPRKRFYTNYLENQKDLEMANGKKSKLHSPSPSDRVDLKGKDRMYSELETETSAETIGFPFGKTFAHSFNPCQMDSLESHALKSVLLSTPLGNVF